MRVEIPSWIERVKQVHPKAFCYRIGALKYEIRRPRESGDIGLVPYVILSSVYSTEERAWTDAAQKLNPDIWINP